MRREKGKGNNSLLFWRRPNSTFNIKFKGACPISNF